MFYLLDENTKIPYKVNVEELNNSFHVDNTIAFTNLPDCYVSTVFLNVGYSIDDNTPPDLFETMIFGGEYDNYQKRYKTYEEALEGHENTLKMIQI